MEPTNPYDKILNKQEGDHPSAFEVALIRVLCEMGKSIDVLTNAVTSNKPFERNDAF